MTQSRRRGIYAVLARLSLGFLIACNCALAMGQTRNLKVPEGDPKQFTQAQMNMVVDAYLTTLSMIYNAGPKQIQMISNEQVKSVVPAMTSTQIKMLNTAQIVAATPWLGPMASKTSYLTPAQKSALTPKQLKCVQLYTADCQ
jgi:hypothetical protein